MNHLIIEGFIGSGKGRVGKLVGKKLDLPVIDVDRLVSEKVRMSTAEIYDRLGEPYYRALETIALGELVQMPQRSVIILGSGVAMMPQNAAYLKQLGRVYYIRMEIKSVIAAMKASKKHSWIRPDSWEDQVTKLYKEREPAYGKVADVVIAGDGKTAEEIAGEILAYDQGT
ncbi:MAG: shikimate kinase [Lachnospiraceae bacterium]|nr:shikimate kinase [Lachnospiraceae bacterium]